MNNTTSEQEAKYKQYVERRNTMVKRIELMLADRKMKAVYSEAALASSGSVEIRVETESGKRTAVVVTLAHDTSGYPGFRATGKVKINVRALLTDMKPVIYRENNNGAINWVKIAERIEALCKARAEYDARKEEYRKQQEEEQKKAEAASLKLALIRDWVKSQEPVVVTLVNELSSKINHMVGSEPTEYGHGLVVEVLTRLMKKHNVTAV